MPFERECYEPDSEIYYVPDSSDWLDQITINYSDPNKPRVQILCIREDLSPAQIALVDQKQAKLLELNRMFDSEPAPQPEDLSLEDPKRRLLRALQSIQIGTAFDASPVSHIRTILTQMEIPQDIQVAVMEDLQKIWSRQK